MYFTMGDSPSKKKPTSTEIKLRCLAYSAHSGADEHTVWSNAKNGLNLSHCDATYGSMDSSVCTTTTKPWMSEE